MRANNLNIYSFYTALYNNHTEWDLVEAKQQHNIVYYGCCKEPFPDVTAEFAIRRRPLFYVLNLLLPMILIGILTLLSFYLPAESGEVIFFNAFTFHSSRC